MILMHNNCEECNDLPAFDRVDLFDPFVDASLVDSVLSYLRKGFDYSPCLGDNVEEFMRMAERRHALAHTILIDGCINGAFATYVENEKDGKTLYLWCLAGEGMDIWLVPLVGFLDYLARHEGCTSVKFGGRIGWEKTLKAFGYKTEHVIMRREL